MRGEDLDINPGPAPRFKIVNHLEHHEFRCIRNDVEHALTGKRPADSHAIEPGHQLIAIPCFKTVGIARPM
jgi:hypothetical protein